MATQKRVCSTVPASARHCMCPHSGKTARPYRYDRSDVCTPRLFPYGPSPAFVSDQVRDAATLVRVRRTRQCALRVSEVVHPSKPHVFLTSERCSSSSFRQCFLGVFVGSKFGHVFLSLTECLLSPAPATRRVQLKLLLLLCAGMATGDAPAPPTPTQDAPPPSAPSLA